MKRWGILVLALTVAVVLIMTLGKKKIPVTDEMPRRSANSDTLKSPSVAERVGHQGPIFSGSLPIAGTTSPEDAWQKKAHDYRELLLNLKPERTGEIEAVAPRLHLSADVVQRLSRWSDVAADLVAASLSEVKTQGDWNRAIEHGIAIEAAHRKAEIRLLGGLDNWNRYYVLKGFSMTGHLDDVDDNGDQKQARPHSPDEKPIGSRHSPHGPPPDTTPYDHYFE